MTRTLSITCLALLLTTACSGDDGGNDNTDQAANNTDESAEQSADVPADQAAGGGASGTQLTECETDVPSDGVCDITVACAAYDPDCTDEDIAAIPPGEESDEASDLAAGGGPAGGSQLTECETDVPSDGVCDITVACAAYDPDCTDEDIAAIPPGEESDEAADLAAGGGPAGGSQLTACDENQEADGICYENEPCAGYDPDCGYEAPDCELEPASDGQCDLDDECWGYDPDCELR